MKVEPKNNSYRQIKNQLPLFSKDILTEEAIDELIKIIKIEKEVNRDDLIFKTDNKKG